MLLVSFLRAEGKGISFAFIDPAGVDLQMIGDPPPEGSSDCRAEIGTLLFLQAGRTPEAAARVATEREITSEAFSAAVGPWFHAVNLPKTAALLAAAKGDTEMAAERAKRLWARTPPPKLDRRIHPAFPPPAGSSYPCADAAVGTVWGFILADLIPEKREGLFVRAAEIGDDQVLAGVRFPSDIVAGRKLGVELVRRMLEDPQFQASLEAARAEVKEAAANKALWAAPVPVPVPIR
ncbi:phosphatase PAP2 family protein [Verrucomicrobium sp. GAS474]|uniref:phosphatase PAP2 family protein n=1 Tax=Verrucomicrobium sp. GAS474 TaxID=1882831 RepID=UPI0013902212|nr:phosphatase PAP2 family protein [Verrucomicrobium sp. GAS474]